MLVVHLYRIAFISNLISVAIVLKDDRLSGVIERSNSNRSETGWSTAHCTVVETDDYQRVSEQIYVQIEIGS